MLTQSLVTMEMNGKVFQFFSESTKIQFSPSEDVTMKDDSPNSTSIEKRKSSKNRSRSRSRHRARRHRSSSRRRSRSRSRRRRSHRSRSRSISKERRRRSRSHDRHKRSRRSPRDYSRERTRRRSRSRSYERSKKTKNFADNYEKRSASPSRGRALTPTIDQFTWRRLSPAPIYSQYERDVRTVFVSQLQLRLKPRELAEFFSQAGKVHDIRIVADKISGRSKGVAYIEFVSEESVPRAIRLSGKLLNGSPVQVQETQVQKSRAAEAVAAANIPGFVRLAVSQIHHSITEDDIRQVFEPFGPVEHVILHRYSSGRSKGYADVQFKNEIDAQLARDKMNGFELGGRTLKVSSVMEPLNLPSSFSTNRGPPPKNARDDMGDMSGVSGRSRVELMRKLAARSSTDSRGEENTPVIRATEYILIKNAFNPEEETEPDWQKEIEEDVRSECSKYGKVFHIHVDSESEGHIYLKFDSTEASSRCIEVLNGRFFAGRQLSAAFVPDAIYKAKFPES